MPAQAAALNTDTDNKRTSSYFGDPGDGVSQWHILAKLGLQQAEDDPSASGDIGIPILAVRRDTPSAGAGTDGDYAMLSVDEDTGGLRVTQTGVGLPEDATHVTAGSGVVANATATATIPAVASALNYLTGFEITAGGATAAAIVTATITGLLGGTRSYIFGVPAGAALIAQPLIVQFAQPIPASAVNTAIVLSVPALGAGNVAAVAIAHGFVI